MCCKYNSNDIRKEKQLTNLLNSQSAITLEQLRAHFHENGFSTMTVKDQSEYNEKEFKLYNRILTLVNTEWKSISKSLGLTHPQDSYSKDYPPELIRERAQRIIADNIVKLRNDKKMFWNVIKKFVLPMILKRKSSDKSLHNTTNALMQTLDIEGLSKSAKDFSCNEDFNQKKTLNYPKMDHDKKWNHSRSKVKVEYAADIHILIENLFEVSSEQEREIIGLLSEGYNQSEIARKLNVS